MNAKELIALLQTFDPLALVVRQVGPNSDTVVPVKAVNYVEIARDSNKFEIYRVQPGSPEIAIQIE